jgi:hypothetical protein
MPTIDLVDPRQRVYVHPTRIVWQTPNDDARSIRDAEVLLAPFTGQIAPNESPACTLEHRGAAPGVLLDFGRELHGSVQLHVVSTVQGNKPVQVRIRLGESVGEAMSELGDRGSCNDHAIRDQTCLVPWCGQIEIGMSGFRFGRIDLIEPNASMRLRAVRAVSVMRDLSRIGTFRCNDDRLNRIFDVGAYTVHLNLQYYLWDGIKRDRLVWVGDMHPEAMTIARVFGDVDVVRHSLDWVRDRTPASNWMNGISSYSLWWVLIHEAWFGHFGNVDYLRAQKAYLDELLARLASFIDDTGSETLDGMRFIDWPTFGDPVAVHAGLQSLMVLAHEAAARIERALGDERNAEAATDIASRLRRHQPARPASKASSAMLALSGLADAGAVNRESLAPGGPSGLSTFFGYYVLQARARAGDHAGALEVIRRYWGGMLDVGATTFWEDFDLDWTKNAGRIDELTPAGKLDLHGDFGAHCYKGFRHSLCHGWASGPTAWLSEHVLGLTPLSPGCQRVAVRPQLADLDWAEGSLPTPYGPVRVRHERRRDGTIVTEHDAPTDVKLVVP